MKRLVIANWKNYISYEEDALTLLKSIRKKEGDELIVCPSPLHLSALKRSAKPKNITIGAQDISAHALTSDLNVIDAKSLKGLGITHTIIGHSHTREEGVTDEMVSEKMKEAQTHGLRIILCVGESEGEDCFTIVRRQLTYAFESIQANVLRRCIIAYEPVTHIGGTEILSPERVQAMSLFIRGVIRDLFSETVTFSFPIVYGGSVSAKSIPSLLQEGEVQGVLVGRASSDQKNLQAIINEVWN